MKATTMERNISTCKPGFSLGANTLSDKVLTDFIIHRNKKSLKDLKGKIFFRDDYDYKSMRS